MRRRRNLGDGRTCHIRQVHLGETANRFGIVVIYYSIKPLLRYSHSCITSQLLPSLPFIYFPSILGSMNTKPQQISREAIDEFKASYEEEFGKTLSDNEVQEVAIRLLRFFGIVTKDGSQPH